jgi:uncharacterized protein (TIGR00255 family)
MLKSMTGYGAAQAQDDTRSYGIEIRSVNHKFCDVKVKLPRNFNALEAQLQAQVRARIARGRVDVFIESKLLPDVSQNAEIDWGLARAYKKSLDELREKLGLSDPVTLSMLSGIGGVLKAPEVCVDLDRISKAMSAGLSEALDVLERMRISEGEGLLTDIETHLSLVDNRVAMLAADVTSLAAQRKTRLEKRLQDILQDVEIDEIRLAQEVAILVDRSDVAEELSRLRIHLNHFREMLSSPDAVGRKLDFLLQEMNREVNTTGSKAANASVAQHVVELKSTLERIREQVQNVE